MKGLGREGEVEWDQAGPDRSLCRPSSIDSDRLPANLIGGRAAQENDELADLGRSHELPGGLLLGEQLEPGLVVALSLRSERVIGSGPRPGE